MLKELILKKLKEKATSSSSSGDDAKDSQSIDDLAAALEEFDRAETSQDKAAAFRAALELARD